MGNRSGHDIGSSDSRLGWNRVGSRLLKSALVLFLCGVIATQSSNAQGATQSGGAQGTAQGSDAAGPAQSDSAQAPAQGSSAQGGNAQAPAQNGNGQGSSARVSNAQAPGENQGGQAQENCEGDDAQATNPNCYAPGNYQGGNTPGNYQGGNTRIAGPRLTPPTPGVATRQGAFQQLPGEYRDFPWLSDLFTRVPSKRVTPVRFGSEIFAFGTGNADELPMDLPVGPDYVLGTGDTLSVNMWGGHTDHLNATIDRLGQVTLPEAGTIMLSGLTLGQAQIAIQKSLSTQFESEHAEVSVGRLRTIRIYVMGDVQRPGAYDVSALSTPLSALFAAGGPTARGSLRLLRQYRADKLVREIDLYEFLLHGIRSYDDRLQQGDTIMVPAVGSQVTVEGVVHHPAVYELNGERDLNQMLDLAGGVLSTASLKQINVERVVAHERRTMVSLDLPDNSEEMKQKLAGFQVQGGDDIVIAQILPYNEQAVFLEGHVYRPGKYPYREGMTITDLLQSYKDVLPEPSDHAELVRLQPPDFKPEVIPFDLHEVLIGNDSIKLQPFDGVVIFSRYDIDPPLVTIDGEVLRPGPYPLTQGMTLTALLHMAGDFTRAAYRDEADLASYVVENGRSVVANHRVVALQKALDGDKSADVVLRPGDVVSIPRLAGWQDIGASVTINGEVEHAGAYGIIPGEHLSSLIKRAGGFRADAYPVAAVLERVQVRELAEQSRQQLILRLQTTPINMRPSITSTQGPSDLQTSLAAQRDQVIAALRNQPAIGRLVIEISTDIGKWQNTSADIEMRAGDTLVIPKRPSFVLVSGQVYNPVAIDFVPGKDIEWYLRKGGGATPYGDKGKIYVLKADGSIVTHGGTWTTGSFLHTKLRPGDSVFVPEKLLGVSPVWQNMISLAQIMASATLPLAIGGLL